MRQFKKKIFSPEGLRENVYPGPAVALDVPGCLYASLSSLSRTWIVKSFYCHQQECGNNCYRWVTVFDAAFVKRNTIAVVIHHLPIHFRWHCMEVFASHTTDETLPVSITC